MIVVHMDSGLGNQMLDYAEYLAIKKTNPDQEIYLEKIIYDIPWHDGMISQWNGYELDRVFGINPPDVKDLIPYQRVVGEIEKSRFWEDNWNYGPYFNSALRNAGLDLIRFGRKLDLSGKSTGGGNLVPAVDSESKKNADVVSASAVKDYAGCKETIRHLLTLLFQKTSTGYHIKRLLRKCMQDKLIAVCDASYNMYREYPENSYCGHSFAFKYKGFGIEKIDKQIREAFKFPDVDEADTRNLEMLDIIQKCNAVSIHARRGDMLSLNGHCYKHGYFKRAVKYIKKHVENPVFIFFTDETSVGWCQENEKIFGLNFQKDKVYFVDWNKGTDSFRDMQLMAQCHHNIFTESTFGFWGAYLNNHPDKITCAPDPLILATRSF